MTPTPPIANRSSSVPWLLFAVFAGFAFLLFFRLGDAPVADKSELRCSDVAQTMLETGDWLVPRRGERLWLNKPPLYYWSIAAVGSVASSFDAFVLRLPAALATLLLLCLIATWGRCVGGPRLGLLAAFLWALMFGVHSQGRMGVAEAHLALFSNAALFVFFLYHTDRGRKLMPLFGLALACAVLAKATTPLLLVLAPIALFLAAQGELRRGGHARVWAWSALGLALGFSWYAIVLIVEPEAWRWFERELMLPFGVKSSETATGTHFKPVWGHVSSMLEMAAPTVLLAPLVIVRAWRTRLYRGDPSRRLLAIVFLTGFVVFSLLPQKRKPYMLPLLPAFALLAADALLVVWSERGATYRRLRIAFVGVAALIGAVVTVGGAYYLRWILAGTVVWIGFALVSFALTVLAARLAYKERWKTSAAAFAGVWVLLVAIDRGSIEVWTRQFKVGTAYLRPDYDQAFWSEQMALRSQVRRKFETDPGWVEIYFGSRTVPPLVSGDGELPTAPPVQ